MSRPLIFTKKVQESSDDKERYLLAEKLGGIVYSGERFKIPNQLDEKAFEERSSNPELMRMVLRGFFDQSQLNKVVEDNFIYKTYSAEDHPEALKNLPDDQLKEYAKIDNLPANVDKKSKRLEIIDELINRPSILKADNINKTNPSSDSFLRLLEKNLEEAAKELKAKVIQEDRQNFEDFKEDEKILSRVKNFLQCEQISTSAKYQFLKHYIEEDIPTSMPHLKSLFQKEEVKEIFKHVFTEAANRYFKGKNSESIYQKEEMPIDVLHHSWNGKKESWQNIQKINQAAVRDLENHPELILKYLKNYISCISNPAQATFEYVTQDQLKTLVSETEDSKLKQSFDEISRRQQIAKDHNALLRREFINSITGIILDEKQCCFNDFPKDKGNQPLMLAMIEQGYIDESVSFFAD